MTERNNRRQEKEPGRRESAEPFLKSCFPMILSRNEILSEIGKSPGLSAMFRGWGEKRQEEFLSFCTGVRGVRLLYDSFFKEIMSPEQTPERLEEFLSLLLRKQVKILEVLPNDSTRIADEKTLLITDIVVELENHEIVNVEIQKIGYMFPGERSACYSADMLLRQYKRVRSVKKKKFSYRDIRSVYTIVLFENSPKEFHSYKENYLHYFSQKSDTGLELELLQKYLFVPLDIFRKIQENRNIADKCEAWLVFLSMDEPEKIGRLLEQYPEFRPLYEQIYGLCRNVGRVMEMFLEELRELDRNTVDLMIDEMQERIERQEEELGRKEEELGRKDKELRESRRQQKEERRKNEEEFRRLRARIAELEKDPGRG